jgi:uncharacterized membrane protein
VGGLGIGLALRLGAFDARRFAPSLKPLPRGLSGDGLVSSLARHLSRIVSAMSDDNSRRDDDAFAEPTIFAATITPHRSLGSTGFLVLMLCIGALSFICGMMFLILGAWPVSGFLGLDVVLIYFAFRANFRAARAYEEVTVTASELTLRMVNPRGGVREWTLNPVWVRLDRIVHEEFGIERLFLVSRGQRLSIASFLGPDEKASFARALSTALGEAKRGPTRTVIQ